MAEIKSFRDLKVWQKAHELVLCVYKITAKFPAEERFGLVSQVRRAVVSVAANIVEGFRRISAKESLRFYDIANASLEELRYEMQVSFDLSYFTKDTFSEVNAKMEEVSKMLNSWIKSQLQNVKAD
mgnify:FL=1